MLSRSTWLPALAAVMMLSVGMPASAQIWGGRDRDRDRDRDWGAGARQDDYSRRAYDNGYRRGVERGERDGRSGRAADFRDEKDYRNGDWGYDRHDGPRDYYRQSFRTGFEAGYYAGYNRYGRGYGYGEGRAVPRDGYGYPAPNGGYGRYGYRNDIGFQNGYRDGLEKGGKDWRSHKSYDVLRHDWYRDGDRHYEREYGPRDQYRMAYREGFKQGYDQAYRGGGRW